MAFQVNYSALDRLVHRVAFGAPSVQRVAAEIDKAVFGAAYEVVKAERPIFITSLPRAGTTVMLEALFRFPSLATHVYRDMPFVMAPIFWSRLSGAFQKRAKLRERAHGDGVRVGYDSPEAFEEVLWRAFWPEKFAEGGIALWSAADDNDEARNFFIEHMKKIIALRRPDRLLDGRYLSKNNGNMARLDLIDRMFPDAKILVPVRHPVEHAFSLLRQHRRFIKMHESEPFTRRYMADLGHFEFGDLHRPIHFPGLEALVSGQNPLTINYWLGYWIAAFEHVAERRDKVLLISLEATCIHRQRALAEICARLEIAEEGALGAAATLFNAPSPPQGNADDMDPNLLKHAEELHKSLFSH